jgi:hypothetical protein
MPENPYQPPKEVGSAAPDYFVVWLRILTAPVPVALLASLVWLYIDPLDVKRQVGLFIRGVHWRYVEVALAVSFAYCAVSVAIWFFLPIVRDAYKQGRAD